MTTTNTASWALAAGQATAAQAVAEPADTVVLNAAMRAIQQAIELIGAPTDVRMRAVRRVLRGAVIVAEDDGKVAPLPSTAYAALPDEGEPWRGHKFKEVQRGCWRCDCGKTIKEVTSDQSTPASGGNYPVMPKRYTVDDDGEELFTAEKMRAFADATHALRASHGQAPAAPKGDIDD